MVTNMAKILVLDDVFDAVVLIKKILERQQHQVVIFTKEEEALQYVKEHEVDLAILDIKLKKINGIEVLRKFKKILPALKTIMLTGYPTVETAREALRFGANEYCTKPIEKIDLEEKVRETLAAH